ncbi:MAG: hypothetical protein L0Y72_15895 [Gemmataceae bacterium]|nr:hypothetical protein [Gemmataceae bacterium]MCI0740530.1 hypothetical protein [Gemmataceae bacterium]
MTTKDEAARKLAQVHYQVEPGMRQIFRLKSKPSAERNPSEPLKLLEINDNTIPSGIVPLGFSPAPGIPYPSIIIEITPFEFDLVKKGKLKLPQSWRIDRELQRE